jgi:hypothetical protein
LKALRTNRTLGNNVGESGEGGPLGWAKIFANNLTAISILELFLDHISQLMRVLQMSTKMSKRLWKKRATSLKGSLKNRKISHLATIW